ncbi:hypothetical protein, partial [Paraburkholderia hospita]|uniref:hypothetical protein n=1 Tax=Paraburkholderia hospita TaxID=169430 RepID=UPI001A982F57
MLEGMAWCLRFSSRGVRRAFCAGDDAVFLAGVGLLNRIVGRFFEIHQHMSATSICWELAKSGDARLCRKQNGGG